MLYAYVKTKSQIRLTSSVLHYVNVSVLIKFSQKTSVFTLIIISSPLNHVLDVY